MGGFDFSNKILIDSTEFQQKVLDYISSCEIDKMIDATVFKDNQECKQAIIHGMAIASMLTSRCKQIEINEVTGMKKCIILEIENKTDFENKMNIYLRDIKSKPVRVIVNITRQLWYWMIKLWRMYQKTDIFVNGVGIVNVMKKLQDE